MFGKLKASLKINGVFVGQFFGTRDEWNKEDSVMTFHSQKDVQELLSNMYIIEFKEEEKDGTTAKGEPKHWHVFYVIAQKK